MDTNLTMTSIKVKIRTRNAAFAGGHHEVARILEDLASQMDDKYNIGSIPTILKDHNGNTVGSVTCTWETPEETP